MVEEWKDIIGYEGLYKISNLGNVKSMKYYRSNTEKIIKSNLTPNKYFVVSLCKNKIKKQYLCID